MQIQQSLYVCNRYSLCPCRDREVTVLERQILSIMTVHWIREIASLGGAGREGPDFGVPSDFLTKTATRSVTSSNCSGVKVVVIDPEGNKTLSTSAEGTAGNRGSQPVRRHEAVSLLCWPIFAFVRSIKKLNTGCWITKWTLGEKRDFPS